MLPTAQAISAVGKRVKSAMEQDEELAEGTVEVCVRDIVVAVALARCLAGDLVRFGRKQEGDVLEFQMRWHANGRSVLPVNTTIVFVAVSWRRPVDSNVSRAMIRESSRNCAFVLLAHGIL